MGRNSYTLIGSLEQGGVWWIKSSYCDQWRKFDLYLILHRCCWGQQLHECKQEFSYIRKWVHLVES